ncbi:hypothetical protein Misp06_01630 [Microbulbifer sp. NBRC 101763]|uniref:hypothetical protein n=1 Tax=Microbulbifer sp. NBRC 101763 TaxID=1113820 RepID=UPI0030ACD866
MSPLINSLPLWLWLLFGLFAMFLARRPVHRAIYALARFSYRSLRLAAGALGTAEQTLLERNREVLLAAGRATAERHIEREFERIEGAMKRELAQYPTLHRRLCEQLTSIDEDYVRSAEVPPEPSNWARAIRSVSEIPAQDDSVVADVLETINHSMRKAESKALESYRESTRERHQLLKRMMPSWRAMLITLGRINKNVESVIRRAKALDLHMERYEEILQESDRSVRFLSASSMGRFLIASTALMVAVAGISVNFQLIARPVAEILGGNSFLGSFVVTDIVAYVLIFLQVSLGIMVMECLQVTRMFPAINTLSDNIRRRLNWAALALLLLFSMVEACLAFTRELLLQYDQLLAASAGEALPMMAGMGTYWPVSLTQMGLGFILPLILAFTAIPLEQFISSARTVIGTCLVLSLRLLCGGLRLLATSVMHTGILLNRFYDLVIFFPLWLQDVLLHYWKERANKGSGGKENTTENNERAGEELMAEPAVNG